MKTPRILGADIEVLRSAVAQLNHVGVEILSAEIRAHAVPMIHIVAHPEITQLDGRYVHCLFDRHHALRRPLRVVHRFLDRPHSRAWRIAHGFPSPECCN